MRYFIIAGERSGDLHASNLVRYLKLSDPEIEIAGYGGDEMSRAGVEILVHYRAMAFMGFWEVIRNIKSIRRIMKQCQQDIEHYQPDTLILVDYAGFNMRMAKYASSLGIRVCYYIAPKVWAWNQGRARKLKALVDHMYCILPFEVEFFRKFDWETQYVGNPVVQLIDDFHHQNSLNLDDEAQKVALLPGSRHQEVKKILPVMYEIVKSRPELKFLLAAVDNLPNTLYADFDNCANVSIIYGQTYEILSQADAAIVTSGTATLETALFEVPQVVVYKTSFFNYWIAKMLIKVPFISLVNLVANHEIVKELIQKDCALKPLSNELNRILGHDAVLIRKDYQQLRKILGKKNAALEAAKHIAEVSTMQP